MFGNQRVTHIFPVTSFSILTPGSENSMTKFSNDNIFAALRDFAMSINGVCKTAVFFIKSHKNEILTGPNEAHHIICCN